MVFSADNLRFGGKRRHKRFFPCLACVSWMKTLPFSGKSSAPGCLKCVKVGGLSVEDLAEKISCDKKSICRWENGEHEPKASTIRSLSLALGCPVSYFFEGVLHNE